MKFIRRTALFVMTIFSTSLQISYAGDEPMEKSQRAFSQLEKIVQTELERSEVNGVSIALIHDNQIIYSRGFGFADRENAIPATENTIYRAGSISKLLTAIAAMRLTELKSFDIDAPVEILLPEFRIVNPYPDSPPITLRRLMCHRSGMVRECPVGGYFDSSQPSLDEVIRNLQDCVLPSAPDAKTRYSNVGPTIVGKAIEKVSETFFEDFVQAQVFDVVGMSNSSWKLKELQEKQMAMGYMSVAMPEGGFQRIRAPRFELGTIPAGNLYTTVNDLGRFITFLINDAQVDGHRLVKSETLAEMYRPQSANASRAFGIGFSLSKHGDLETVAHMGAVYGFTSSLVAIPSKKVGAVVLSNEDLAIGTVQRLMNASLDTVLAYDHETASLNAAAQAVPPETAAEVKQPSIDALNKLVGEYESASYWAEITIKDGKLQATVSGQTLQLEPRSELEFTANGRLFLNTPIKFEPNENGSISSFNAFRQKFTKVEHSQQNPAPENWSKFVGSFGPEFIPLIISIRHGHLYAMTENEMDYRLTPMNRFVFRLTQGMYDDEQLIFQEGDDGHIHSVIMANFPLKRITSSKSR